MPPTLVTDQGATVTTFATYTVELIDYLTAPGGWVVVPYLLVNTLRVAVNAIDTAELVYHLGEGVVQPGAATFANYQPLAAKGKFVRVTIAPEAGDANIVWVGHVLSDDVARDGVKDDAGTNKLTGDRQTLQCVGLEWFLDRKQIDSAVVHRTVPPSELAADPNAPDYVRIYRPLVFNGGPTGQLDPASGERANRHATVNLDTSAYDFADDFDEAELWTASQILNHVLEYHTPLTAAGGAAPCDFILDPADGLAGFLDGFVPTLRTENRTVFELLNELAKPQRGLVWWTEFFQNEITTQCRIRVQSLADSAVALPGGGVLPANNNQETLDFDTELDVARVKVKELGMRDYHQVVVRGARMTSTCTVGMPDETLEEDWATGAIDHGGEPNYRDAAKFDPDYADLSDAQKRKRNDAMRRAEQFYRVFCAFRIPADWDGKTSDGGGGVRGPALAELSPTGSVLGVLPIHAQGLKLLNLTRLKRGWDYQNPLAPKANSPAGSQPEFLPPFAFLEVCAQPRRWQFAEKMREHDFAPVAAPEGSEGAPVSPDIKTSYHLRMQQTVPGILLDPAGGLNHAVALNHWAETADGGTALLAEPSGHKPEVDYETLRATVCIEADLFCEAKYPTAGFPANVPLNVLVIDAGDRYRLDFLAANTVVDLDKGQLVKAGSPAVLRDDRQRLADIARLAYEWYRLDRQSLSVTFRQTRNLFQLGMLITAIGSGTTQESINTVVSAITWDMENGQMTVDTHDDTLDARSFVA